MSVTSRMSLAAVVAAVSIGVAAQPFGSEAVYPSITLVKYQEDTGQVAFTQIPYATATVRLKAINRGSQGTDPFRLSISDSNGLWKHSQPGVLVPAIKPGQSFGPVDIVLSPDFVPATTQEDLQHQFDQWQADYKNRCGVDLRAELEWSGPVSQAPMNGHQQQDVYLGYGSSRDWDENRNMDATVCDDHNCVSLNAVARSIYKQLACKVVGYSFFAGDQISGPSAFFGAFGKARTALNPPQLDFSPQTKMQIASTSKLLTALTGVRVFKSKMNTDAYPYFPSNWTLPQFTIVKDITLRQFLSQTSGVQQHDGRHGQDFESMEEFFTQPIPDPNGPATCGQGPFAYLFPIVSDKKPCYSNLNFGIMRLVLPRFAGHNTNDPAQLSSEYQQEVRDRVLAPAGVKHPESVGCKPPANGNYALPYRYPGNQFSYDWGDLSSVCGDWGWYLSVEDYARVMVSLKAADHKILSDCDLWDMEFNPPAHPVGFDLRSSGGYRWLEKNGGDMGGGAVPANRPLQTTSVAIFGGHSGCKVGGFGIAPVRGVAGVLWINSDIAGQEVLASGFNARGASEVLFTAFASAAKPKN